MPSLFYKVLGKENFFFWEGVMTYNKVLWGGRIFILRSVFVFYLFGKNQLNIFNILPDTFCLSSFYVLEK